MGRPHFRRSERAKPTRSEDRWSAIGREPTSGSFQFSGPCDSAENRTFLSSARSERTTLRNVGHLHPLTSHRRPAF